MTDDQRALAAHLHRLLSSLLDRQVVHKGTYSMLFVSHEQYRDLHADVQRLGYELIQDAAQQREENY